MKLSNTNRFWLPGTGHRALHLATILDGLREYICLYLDGKIYIEEITGEHLEYIVSDEKAEELVNFLNVHGILGGDKPLLPDSEWLRLGKK